MALIYFSSLPEKKTDLPPGQAPLWLARLEGFLSPGQKKHLLRFKNSNELILRLLTRLHALKFSCNRAMLDRNREGKPFFRGMPQLQASFSYAEKSAFSAFHLFVREKLPTLAIDAMALENCENNARNFREWFKKFPLSQKSHKSLCNFSSWQIMKLWLLQECLIKLKGFSRAFAQLGHLIPVLEINHMNFDSDICHAAFLTYENFIVCIASNHDIFFRKPIEIIPCQISIL